MYLLAGPLEVKEDDSPLGLAAASIYGAGFSVFRFAHLAFPDGVGLELFHFENPVTKRRDNNFEFWMTGIYHLSVTARDASGLARRIAEHGGRMRAEPVVINEEKGYTIIYCEDPWGTIIEICSHPYVQMWA